MKNVLIIFLMFCASSVVGQKTKTINIYEKSIFGERVNAFLYYDVDDNISRINIVFTGKNAKYSQLEDYITLYSGTPIAFCKFLDEIVKFSSENEPDVSIEIEGQTVKTFKMLGAKGIYLYEKNGNGYKDLNPKTLIKMKNKLIDWCKKNNVAYE